MEDYLVDKNRLLEDVIESIHGGIFQLVVHDNGTMLFTYRSPRAYELAHLPPDWTLGINAHPEDRDRLAESVHESIGSLSPWSFEGRCILASGDLRWVEGRALPTRMADAVVLTGLLLDVTDRRNTEEALRESEARFRTILGSINDAVFVHDAATGAILDVNERACELYGLPREDFLTGDVGAISSDTPPYTQKEARALLKKAADGEPQLVEWHARDSSGRLFWVEVNLRKATIGGRETVLVVVRDISRRKQAEEAFKQSEERYRNIVETSQEGIWLIDADAKTTYVNQRMADMLGYTREEMLGRPTLDFVYESQLEKARAGLERRRLGERGQNEICYRRKDGTELWSIISSSPLMDDNGRFIGALGMVADITDRKRTEEALRESEARFTLAQSAADIGTWEHDLESGALIWSRNLLEMFGVPPSASPPSFEDWIQMIHPDDRQRVQDDLARTLSERVPLSTEYRFVCPNGAVRSFMGRAHVVYGEDGTPVRLVGIAMDITQTVELRQALQRQLMLLQQALVPPVPSESGGYRTAAVYVPASLGENIGGDLYDIFTTEDGQIGLLIGDVAGKGVEAASLAAAARSTVRSFAYELSSSGLALSHADAALASQAGGFERFVTAFLAIIDPTTGWLNYAGAGHPQAAIWRIDGRIDFLEYGGPPLGASSGYQYAEFESHLDPGDKIILYTDGVIESRRGLDFFDMEGVERAVAEHGSGTPDEVAGGLLDAARDWAGGPLRDDVAIVVVERSLS